MQKTKDVITRRELQQMRTRMRRMEAVLRGIIEADNQKSVDLEAPRKARALLNGAAPCRKRQGRRAHH